MFEAGLMKHRSAKESSAEGAVMKPSRFYWQTPIVEPDRTRDELSEEERKALRASVVPVMEQFRKKLRIQRWAFAMSLPWLLLFAVYKQQPAGVFVFAALVLTLIIAFCLNAPLPNCPACTNYLDRKIGPFCPRCGSRSHSPGESNLRPRCAARGCNLAVRKGDRCYKIHFCTFCGLEIDKLGI
jgi:hypothetical protein